MPAPKISRDGPRPCVSDKNHERRRWLSDRFTWSEVVPGASLSGLDRVCRVPVPPSPVPAAGLSDESLECPKNWKDLHLDIPLHDGTALHIVVIHSEHWLGSERVSEGHGMIVNLPQVSYKGMALLTAIRPAEWAASSEGELKAVFHRFTDVDDGILVLGARRTRPAALSSAAETCVWFRWN